MENGEMGRAGGSFWQRYYPSIYGVFHSLHNHRELCKARSPCNDVAIFDHVSHRNFRRINEKLALLIGNRVPIILGNVNVFWNWSAHGFGFGSVFRAVLREMRE